jgi:hypothetical protein
MIFFFNVSINLSILEMNDAFEVLGKMFAILFLEQESDDYNSL